MSAAEARRRETASHYERKDAEKKAFYDRKDAEKKSFYNRRDDELAAHNRELDRLERMPLRVRESQGRQGNPAEAASLARSADNINETREDDSLRHQATGSSHRTNAGSVARLSHHSSKTRPNGLHTGAAPSRLATSNSAFMQLPSGERHARPVRLTHALAVLAAATACFTAAHHFGWFGNASVPSSTERRATLTRDEVYLALAGRTSIETQLKVAQALEAGSEEMQKSACLANYAYARLAKSLPANSPHLSVAREALKRVRSKCKVSVRNGAPPYDLSLLVEVDGRRGPDSEAGRVFKAKK